MNSQSGVSETAIVTASLRALACFEDDGLVRHKDTLAHIFLPDDKRVPLENSDLRNHIKKMIPEGLYEYVIARTGYYDNFFCDHLNRNVPQIVLLGAGFDTRPYRYSDLIRDTLIFEADAPATQEYKRTKLANNQIDCHKNIRYVPVDFEKDNLRNALISAGFRSDLCTLYIWEGVTFYLTPSAVAAVLHTLRSNSAKHSLLSFDFQSIDHENNLIDTGLKDERIRFGIKDGMIKEYLEGSGYALIEHVGSKELCERYLTAKDGSLFGSIKSIMNIVTAEMIK